MFSSALEHLFMGPFNKKFSKWFSGASLSRFYWLKYYGLCKVNGKGQQIILEFLAGNSLTVAHFERTPFYVLSLVFKPFPLSEFTQRVLLLMCLLSTAGGSLGVIPPPPGGMAPKLAPPPGTGASPAAGRRGVQSHPQASFPGMDAFAPAPTGQQQSQQQNTTSDWGDFTAASG